MMILLVPVTLYFAQMAIFLKTLMEQLGTMEIIHLFSIYYRQEKGLEFIPYIQPQTFRPLKDMVL
uniref:Uncharacterized protein n=1 Tax=virus sp. ctDYl1 TaxID=2826795 RepID=A0A8S5R8X1_9VIRU|nr:MAG TPA: hypothetical protein [virus sp. ctDYl1]